MADWKVTSPIDYSPNGDDVDRFAQKSIATFEEIFEHLNALRRHGAKAGLDESDTSPYELRIDTTTDTIYMRDGADKKWLRLGAVAEFFGIQPGDIGAVENGGGMKRLYAGNEANKPTEGCKTNDLFFAIDKRKLYVWEGSDWHVLLSLDFGDMLHVDGKFLLREEAATSGANKVLRLDPETGKGDIDITGSADHMLGKEIKVTALHDKDVLMWDSLESAFVNAPKDIFTEDDATYTGEKGKLVRVNSDGKAHVDIAGSADKMLGKPIEIASLAGGDVLAYDADKEVFVNCPKDFVGAADVTEDGAAGKVVRVAQDGTIHANVTGNASDIGGVKVTVQDIADGEILAYHLATGTFVNEPRGAISGAAKSFILRDNSRILGDYNGARTVDINLTPVLKKTADSVTNHLERLVGTLYAAVIAAGISPDGYDAMVVENFDGQAAEIDTTVAKVTSVVSGDNSIDVDDSSDLMIGDYYQLTDGEMTEEVQIKSINVSDDINRVILMEPVKNQYHSKRAKLYRSTVAILNGLAYGGGNTAYHTAMDEPETFAGSNTTQALQKVIDFGDPTSFEITGGHVQDGKLVVGIAGYGIVLAVPGDSSGTWVRVNSEGEDLKDSDLT
ncbi:MAG: hypothetical protein MR630_11590 [Selenomonas sp.]|uniref:hypothetical protein n=1 Tax=Selenomonas sp. TaxID=2053611 RepID=UPI0025D5E787|nr:hypothetical protein [Selenomonas sp.]MCI6233232.1 hypothetical protein [Selenomonas sp.]MDD6127596.1 hypothetical protein [Veillonellaceae bacterium]